MAEIFCEHGFLRRKRCPVCGERTQGGGKRGNKPDIGAYERRAKK